MAKEKGRNRVHIYQADDVELSSRKGEMEWVSRIKNALDQQRFRLYAQEIVPLESTGSTRRHIEVLVRMLDEEGKLISPLAFIPAAERYNLMPRIDRWIIGTAFSQLAQLRQLGQWRADDLCAINLSAASLGEESTFDFIARQIEEHAIPYSSICFELTETAAISIIAKAAEFMHKLRGLGCRFALDDFGAGMSSFGYLKHLPVDYLKIDGAFVKDMGTDPIDAAMVEAINGIGHVMGKQTIAEFVENTQVLSELQRIGVDFAQGYGIAKPVPFWLSHNLVALESKPTLERA
jgi:EAL domain-containing protein (putative c-di-GMP-specific phosphodiesterase class I)